LRFSPSLSGFKFFSQTKISACKKFSRGAQGGPAKSENGQNISFKSKKHQFFAVKGCASLVISPVLNYSPL